MAQPARASDSVRQCRVTHMRHTRGQLSHGSSRRTGDALAESFAAPPATTQKRDHDGGGNAAVKQAKLDKIFEFSMRQWGSQSGAPHAYAPTQSVGCEVRPSPVQARPFTEQQYVDGTSRVLEPDGSRVQWPWQSAPWRQGPHDHKMGPPIGMSARIAKADELVDQAMLASSADGEMGENATGVRA